MSYEAYDNIHMWGYCEVHSPNKEVYPCKECVEGEEMYEWHSRLDAEFSEMEEAYLKWCDEQEGVGEEGVLEW